MVLQFLLWFGVTLLALAVLFAILPIHIALSWQNGPARRLTVLLRPFGGVFPAIKVFDSTSPRKAKPAQPKKPKTREKTRAPRGNMMAEGVLLLRRVLGAIHFEAFHLDAEFGLGDPAETGQLFGQLCPVIYGTGIDMQLRPNFDRACFRGNALARFRVTPVAVAWPFVGFGWRVFGPGR